LIDDGSSKRTNENTVTIQQKYSTYFHGFEGFSYLRSYSKRINIDGIKLLKEDINNIEQQTKQTKQTNEQAGIHQKHQWYRI
jgi:hypothetical protein